MVKFVPEIKLSHRKGHTLNKNDLGPNIDFEKDQYLRWS